VNKTTGPSGRRKAGSGGVSKVSRVSSKQMGHVTLQGTPHTPFQDPPGSGTHGFDSNSPRLSGLEK